MSKVIAGMTISLDGFVNDNNGSDVMPILLCSNPRPPLGASAGSKLTVSYLGIMEYVCLNQFNPFLGLTITFSQEADSNEYHEYQG